MCIGCILLNIFLFLILNVFIIYLTISPLEYSTFEVIKNKLLDF